MAGAVRTLPVAPPEIYVGIVAAASLSPTIIQTPYTVPILTVWRVYHNQRVFPCGKCAGPRPLDLASLPVPHWHEAVGYGRLWPVPELNVRRSPFNPSTAVAA